MSEGRDLFSRDEILGGLPARRARSLAFLIERQTVSHMATREVGPMAMVGEGAAQERSLAWFDAFASAGEDELRRPSIREIEAAAGSWAPLVPEAPPVRAAAARILAERHELDHDRVPQTRAALGLDTPEVAAAFRRQGDEEIDSIYSKSGLIERIRWTASAPGRWLESTTPYMAAATLTFLLSMGQSVVIVPIAVATVGLPVALASILVIGIFSLSTTAAIAEATTRNGEVRLRGGFFGRLVTSALGGPAGSVPAILGIASIVLPTLSIFVGFALLLELTIPIPAVAWIAILGVIGVVTPLKRPRSTSFGGLMTIGILSTALVAALCVLVLIEAAVGGELRAPPLEPPGDIGVDLALGVIIGVLLAAYADPVYTVQVGRLVLPNDPDGSGYVRGSVMGMALFVVLTAIFSFVLLLVVPAGELAGQAGSALDPLADAYGAEVLVVATLIGITLFGLRLYGNAIALFDFVDERLPGRRPPRVVLRAGRGHVLLTKRDAHAPALVIAYRGLRGGAPVISLAGGGEGERRLGGAERIEAGEDPVTLEVLSADENTLRLAVDTPLAISYDADAGALGPSVAESLLAEDEGAELVAWLLREGSGRPALAAERFGWKLEVARARLDALVEDGRAERTGPGTYSARLGSRRASALDDDIWGKLSDDDVGAPREGVESAGGGLERILASPVARAIVSSVPIAALAVTSVALVAAGTASVSGPFRIVGVIGFATISGVLPPMLLIAARRRSDIAGVERAGALVSAPMLALTAILAFAVLILHATILWDDPIEKACAAIATVFAAAAVLLAIRHGAFRPTVLVELRRLGEGDATTLRVEEAGEPLATEVQIAGGGREGFELQLAEGALLTIEGRPVAASELVVSAQRFEGGAASALEFEAELVRGSGAGAGESARLAETGGTKAFRTAGEWTLRVGPTRSGLDRS